MFLINHKIKALFDKLASSLLNEDEKKTFLETVKNSRDLPMLLVENDIIDYVDSIDGIVKIVLTVGGMLCQSKIA